MRIGEVIRKYRKEKGLTQEELAVRLGVTAPAVNKWERNVTAPDIALLTPIARLLGITTDTLLSYQAEPSTQEIDALAEQIDELLRERPYADVFAWVREQLRPYSNSAQLHLRLGQLLDARRVMADVPEEESYDAELTAWISLALESGVPPLTQEAAHWLYALAMRRERYEEAEGYLAYLPENDPQRKRMKADIYAKTGREEEAYKALEELLYAERITSDSVFASLYLLAMNQGDHAKARYYEGKRRDLARLFEMGAYHECTGLELAIAEKDPDAALPLLETMLKKTESIFGFRTSPLYAHMDFRDVDDRFLSELRRDLIAGLRSEDFLREDPRFRALAMEFAPE